MTAAKTNSSPSSLSTMTNTATISILPGPARQSPVSVSNFPLPPNSKPLQRNFLPDVAAETSTDLTVIETIADGYSLSMRRDDPARCGLKLLAHLEYCAKTYCGAGGTDQNVYTECADFAMTHYGHLGVDEIRQAFGLAAAGKLTGQNDEPVNIRAYHGAFTVLMLGDLLAAYDNYRRRLLPKIVKLEIEAKAPKQWDETEWATKRLQTLKQLAFDDALTMNDAAEIDYTTFERLGMYTPDEDKKRAAWVKSESAVRSEIATAAMSDISMRTMLQHLTTAYAKEFQDKRVGWCRRRLVVDWVESLVAVEVTTQHSLTGMPGAA